ncbi:hypothetical protein ACNF40_00535 [Cuniculiplasma sp. SKW4]|uniref:hypothetical protein n=1 Tax=Cuniculiplasma sp. SKW4 TaxID=3400171 RepID=UPI003FD29594
MMKLEIGDSLTLEFDRNLFGENTEKMPVNIYSGDFQRVEIIELNNTMRKGFKKILERTVEPVVFINIKRISKLRYEFVPGTALISKDQKNYSFNIDH